MTNDAPPPGFDRVYHLAPLRFAKTNIEFRRLKVATFSDANDPFEAKALNLRGRRNREARQLLKEFKASQDEQTGMLCFSRTSTNPVLWSHYAEGHKGVCLGCDVKADLLEPVEYTDSLLTARLNDETDPSELPDELQRALLVTKFHHWQYETEVRRFVSLSDANRQDGIYFWPFDENMILREVVLGPLCPRSELEPMRASVASANVPAVVSRARLGFGSFEVRPDGRYPPH